MTRRRGKLQACIWCGLVVDPFGERVCLTYDYDGCRYHARCLVLKLYAKVSPPSSERRP